MRHCVCMWPMRHCGLWIVTYGTCVWIWPMRHCGMDVAYGTLWYGCGLWDTVVWMWPMGHCGMDVTYETLWYGCDLCDEDTCGMDGTFMGHVGMDCVTYGTLVVWM